jgi:hypothetical protein
MPKVRIDNYIQEEEQKAQAAGKLPFVFELIVE